MHPSASYILWLQSTTLHSYFSQGAMKVTSNLLVAKLDEFSHLCYSLDFSSGLHLPFHLPVAKPLMERNLGSARLTLPK